MTNQKMFAIHENLAKLSKDDCVDYTQFRKSAELLKFALYECDFTAASVYLSAVEDNLGLRLYLTGDNRTAFLMKLHTVIGKVVTTEENPEYSAAKSALKTALNCQELGIAISEDEITRLKADVERTKLLPRACVRDLGYNTVTTFINRLMVAYAAEYCKDSASLEDLIALEVERKEARKAARRAARAAKKNA